MRRAVITRGDHKPLSVEARRQRRVLVRELLRLDQRHGTLHIAREAVATALFFAQRGRLLIQEEAA